MKLNLKNLFNGILIILMIYFGVKSYQDWKEKDAVFDKINLTLKKQEVERIDHIKKLQKDSADFVIKIDSLKHDFNALEKRRIFEKKYYQNRLSREIKKRKAR